MSRSESAGLTRARYDRVAPIYDLLEWLPERGSFGRWRVRLWSRVSPRRVMDGLDPFVVRFLGAHINRRTVENVRAAGLEIERLEDLAPWGMVRLIVARVS